MALEALEPRITPANFFIGSDGAIVDAHGEAVEQYTDNGAADWASTLSKVGAESAFLFKKGDKLGFDTNGNGKFDKGENVLVNLKGGAAVFFLNTADEGSEIAGISAAGKFGGTVSGVVGSIITNLIQQGSGKNARYDFAPLLLGGQIKSLTIDGYMHEGSDIISGGGVAGLTITGADPANGMSAWRVASKYGYMGELFFGSPSLAPGTHGADITKVISAGGIKFIEAGDAISNDIEENSKTNAGRGGSVSKISIAAGAEDISIKSGSGGYGDFGRAGVGGDIKDISITNVSGQNVSISAVGGNTGATVPGAGGSVSKIRITGEDLALLSISSGSGGDGITGGAKGGEISDVVADVTRIAEISLISGSGGRGNEGETPRGVNGGAGGSISDIYVLHREEVQNTDFTSTNSVGNVTIKAGGGGIGFGSGYGGNGGSVSDIYLPIETQLLIDAGKGGSGEQLTEDGRYGKAGVGGDVERVIAFLMSSQNAEGQARVAVHAGDAGDYGFAEGGSVDGVFVVSRTRDAESIEIFSGRASESAGYGRHNGADGGDVNQVVIFVPKIGSVSIAAKYGGDNSHLEPEPYLGAKAGAGGSVDHAWIFSSEVDKISILGGTGGIGRGSLSVAGNGGDVSDVLISGLFTDEQQFPGIFHEVEIRGGSGGEGFGSPDVAALASRGGNGGNLRDIIGPSFNTYEVLEVAPGPGAIGSMPQFYGKDGKSSNVQISSSSQFLSSIEE